MSFLFDTNALSEALRRRPNRGFTVSIAATAIHYRLTLVTANLRHYDRVPGLKLMSFQPGEGGKFEAP